MSTKNCTFKLHYGFIIIISIFIQMFLGGAFLQTSGLFVLPVTGALKINQGTYMMYMTVQYIVMAITATFAPKLLSRFRFGTLNRCGIVIMGLGILLMSIAGSVFLIYLGGALIGIFYSIANVQLPAMVTTLYGERDYGSICPVAAAFSPWFGAVSSSLWGFLYDATGSYNAMHIAGIALTALTAIACFLAVKASKKLKAV